MTVASPQETRPPTPSGFALEIMGLGKSFGQFPVLDGVELKLRPGSILGLVGQNGAGKSTLIKILTRAHTQYEGSIRFAGVNLRSLTPKAALKAGIAAVYQELDLVDDLSISENVFLGHELKTAKFLINKQALRERTRDLLSVLGLDADPDVLVGSLSLAHKQQVALARALSMDAKLLILDEPTASLSAQESQALLAVMKQLAREGRTIIFISHRLDEVFQVCDAMTVLRGGRVIGTRPVRSWTRQGLIEAMTGRSETLYPDREAVTVGKTLLEAKNVSQGKQVKDVSLQIKSGEILGIAGLVGAGRTELLRCLAGIDRYQGKVLMNGIEVTTPKKALQAGVAYAPEDRKGTGLILDMTLEENLTLPTLKQHSAMGWISKKNRKKAARKGVQDLGIHPPVLDREVRYFSGGNQQKAVVARWLLTGVDVLLLDEPTRGVDIGAKADLFRLMRSLVKSGKGVVFVSSELEEVAAISDRVLVMVEGKVVAELPGGSTEKQILQSIYSGD